MKPILKIGLNVTTQSRLYQNKWPGAKSWSAGTIGVVTCLEGGYYQGTLVCTVATVEFERGFTVRVNERALRPIQ